MIAAMPRPRPPHLHRETNRHGTTVWYVRVDKGPRIRLRAEFGTDEFREQYQAALAGEKPQRGSKSSTGTLAWLIDRYRDSGAWTKLSVATRRQRENIFSHVIKTAGFEKIGYVDRKAIVAGRDRRRATPNAARHFVQTMRGLFEWATQAGHAPLDPTVGVDTPRPATEGFETWPAEWCAAYEARWPIGTRQRLAYDVLFYSGLRRGDAVRFGRPHVKQGIGTIRTEKTGEIVTIVIAPQLQASIDAGPCGELTFIASESGKPLTKESFGNFFRDWCRLAGVDGSAHGLRKARATIAAERGATEAELDAMFGWRGGRMAAHYTQKANRAQLAIDAAEKVNSERPANIYSRTLQSGAGRKRKKTDVSRR